MKKKLLSAILALAIVAAPSLGFVENTDSLAPNCQITASAAQAKSGWVKEGGNWYYYIAGSKARSKWIQSKGKWYYLKWNGVMATGWEKITGYWYYFDTVNGDMYSGRWLEKKISSKESDWYYLGNSGIMYANQFLFYNNKWYYFDKDGIMLKNRMNYFIPNHGRWNFHADGHGDRIA